MSIPVLIAAFVLSQVAFTWHGLRYPALSIFTLNGIRNLRTLCAHPEIRKVEILPIGGTDDHRPLRPSIDQPSQSD